MILPLKTKRYVCCILKWERKVVACVTSTILPFECLAILLSEINTYFVSFILEVEHWPPLCIQLWCSTSHRFSHRYMELYLTTNSEYLNKEDLPGKITASWHCSYLVGRRSSHIEISLSLPCRVNPGLAVQ